jgi:molybdopterin converting factor small subunit
MAHLLLLGPAREAAGLRNDDISGDTVAKVLDQAASRYGANFRDILVQSQVWVNGEPADEGTAVGPDDEVAILPPISGG